MKTREKMKNKLVYESIGRNGGFLRAYTIPKEKRHKGVDGIKLVWASDDEIKKKVCNYVQIKDWEALLVIEALVSALIVKKGGIGKRR